MTTIWPPDANNSNVRISCCHVYERRILTPLRIDGRVFLDRGEIDSLYERDRAEAYWHILAV